MRMIKNVVAVEKSGKYRLSLTSLIKSGKNDPFTLRIRRKDEIIGETRMHLGAVANPPEVGVSTTILMMKDLMQGDLLKIETGSKTNL